MVGYPEDGSSLVLQNVGIFRVKSLQPEDGGSMALQNVDIVPQHYMAS
jgi:hypothetical protein